MSTTPINSGSSFTITNSDILGRCPSCYGNNVSKIGIWSYNGTQTDAKQCNNCNRTFTDLDGGIRAQADHLDNRLGSYSGANVGFVSTNAQGTSSQNYQAQQSMQQGYAYNGTLNNSTIQANISNWGSNPDSYKLDEINRRLGEMKQDSFSMLQQLMLLNSTIAELTKQNYKLMEKLATDPLNGMRKAISEFNLK